MRINTGHTLEKSGVTDTVARACAYLDFFDKLLTKQLFWCIIFNHYYVDNAHFGGDEING